MTALQSDLAPLIWTELVVLPRRDNGRLFATMKDTVGMRTLLQAGQREGVCMFPPELYREKQLRSHEMRTEKVTRPEARGIQEYHEYATVPSFATLETRNVVHPESNVFIHYTPRPLQRALKFLPYTHTNPTKQ